jgi:hypothetical protein
VFTAPTAVDFLGTVNVDNLRFNCIDQGADAINDGLHTCIVSSAVRVSDFVTPEEREN